MKDTRVAKILVPVDFSEHGDWALAYALMLAEKLASRVTILHIFSEQEMHDIRNESPNLPVDKILEERKSSLRQHLKELRARNGKNGNNYDIVLVEGDPCHEIIRYAEDNDIDLIVMGSGGKKTLSEKLLGDVAYKVVRRAKCQVLRVSPR
jgi:nucleotide-binding universal stress UspA family protein